MTCNMHYNNWSMSQPQPIGQPTIDSHAAGVSGWYQKHSGPLREEALADLRCMAQLAHWHAAAVVNFEQLLCNCKLSGTLSATTSTASLPLACPQCNAPPAATPAVVTVTWRVM
jgi:hypothetical protein